MLRARRRAGESTVDSRRGVDFPPPPTVEFRGKTPLPNPPPQGGRGLPLLLLDSASALGQAGGHERRLWSNRSNNEEDAVVNAPPRQRVQYKDLREYLDLLEEAGLLKHVTGE